MNEEEVRNQAIEFARRHKQHIAEEFVDIEKYTPDAHPISVFMAGSPGAGKTELSKNLISILEEGKERHVIRIDQDEFLSRIPGYSGSNAYLFQGAAAILVERIHDLALHNGQSFVLDSTFSHLPKATENIRRSMERKRGVIIFYLFQLPEVAWKFTQAREQAEGRRISKEAFIDAFLGAKETINRVLQEFGSAVAIFFVKKDFLKNEVEKVIRLQSGSDTVDKYLPVAYTKEDLENTL